VANEVPEQQPNEASPQTDEVLPAYMWSSLELQSEEFKVQTSKVFFLPVYKG
jgi:hypothetical protein